MSGMCVCVGGGTDSEGGPELMERCQGLAEGRRLHCLLCCPLVYICAHG